MPVTKWEQSMLMCNPCDFMTLFSVYHSISQPLNIFKLWQVGGLRIYNFYRSETVIPFTEKLLLAETELATS